MCARRSACHHRGLRADRREGIGEAQYRGRILANSARDTQLVFHTNTARVADNEISRKVVEIEKAGGTFDAVRDPVSGARGRRVFEEGDLEAGIWSA
ncbi:hypothetical protein AB0H00_01080 [Nocardia sp. NPDC023852]|uniref:hypothetical protein n=1 Tax=Nocardia sp. NPDC023852 TaxID=3154697 RepID=UPI0033C541B4